MDFHRYNNLHRSITAYCLLIAVMAGLSFQVNAASIPEQIKSLEKRFRSVSTEIYSDLIRQNVFGRKRFKSVGDLEQEVLSLVANKKTNQAIYLIRQNLKLIEENIDDRAIFYLVEQLLNHNEWNTANTILRIVQEEGDRSLISNVTFIFAKYYANRKRWPETLRNLAGVINDLPTEDGHYALILQGIAEQSRRNHRKAVKYYSRIPQTSRYYPIAVLNIAVAYIRQGWWTDSKLLIEKLLKNPKARINDELINRLYLVNGYSLLKEGYFRNSRESFRNISLESRYTNRALLGIALTATNQEDFIGALNAINFLKQKKSQDLSVDEAHLMLPYVYEKLKQPLTATSGYTAALAYYQKRISDINATIKNKIRSKLEVTISKDRTRLVIDSTELEFSKHYPKSFLQNHTELQSLGKFTDNLKPSTRKKYARLFADHEALLKTMSEALLQDRIKQLKSYMSQSRFGLARMYDSTAVPGN